jgi:hypothetical protein
MPSEYDSRDDSYDSRYDSYDSRYDSAPPPPPPPRKKVGYGIAGMIIAAGGMGVAVVLAVVTLFFRNQLRPPENDANGMGLACSQFVLLILFLLSACVMVLSLTGAGLGVGGITAGHGRGRRLGVYAVCLALIPITAVFAIVAAVIAAWN